MPNSSSRNKLLAGSSLGGAGAVVHLANSAPGRSALIVATLLFAVPALGQSAPALPTGGAFAAGAGTIQTAGSTMTITQSTVRGVVDWKTFSIGADARVQIDNAAGATLNRVLNGQVSRIDGMLTATGSVYLMNTAGMVFGPGGKVLTGGDFVASTRVIDPGQFMAGGALNIRGNSAGTIENQGSIVSSKGSIVMIARSVTNSGSLSASQGQVTLAAANDVLLATTDGRAAGIYVSVGSGGAGDVTQEGRIAAAAVALKAADGNIFALAGNRDGLVTATGTSTVDGELWLTAPNGTVTVSGVLAASNADGTGGKVVVTGANVALASTASVSATGTRGGEVLVGTSGAAGGADIAQQTTIADGAKLAAGGAGGGGRIETSGHSFKLGAASVSAGAGGTWVVDPNDLVIDTAAASTIVGSLNGGNDVLQQTTASGTGGSGDITVAAPIVWTGAGSLTFNAYRDILVNQQISGAGNLTLTAARNISVGAPVSAATVTGTAASILTIAAGASVAATANVTLQTGTFVNLAGAGALSAGGQWLVYSGNPANDTPGGLAPAFYQYNAPAGAAPAQAGNGLLYSVAPTVTVTLGNVTKSYDGTNIAPLDTTNTTVAGLINGDNGWTLDGTYAGKNVDTGIDVTATGIHATHAGIPVYGYALSSSVTAAVGTITAAVLTANITGTPTKTYNRSVSVELTSANFQLIGLAPGETIAVSNPASASYASANAGTWAVNATLTISSFKAGSGTLLSNYVLPTTATGPGLINPATLEITGLDANNKVYDGTTAATLILGSASLFGAISGDTVTLDTSNAAGTFATRNVGTNIPITASGFALKGASAANYVLASPGGLSADITAATVTISGLVANSKVYDGTNLATLNESGLHLNGIIPGDDVAPLDLSQATITFATKNAGSNIPVAIGNVALSGTDAGNYNLDVSSASLAANITQRKVTITGTTPITKVYDGTTTVLIASGSGFLGNLVAGESITVSQVANIHYVSKNAGAESIKYSFTTSDFIAGPNTLLSNYILPSSGTAKGQINPAPLTITIVGNPTKNYDGNANVSLGPSNFLVTGFVPNEGATVTQTSGTYSSSNVGVWAVSASLGQGNFAPNSGTLMSNYFIPSPVTGFGTIVQTNIGPGDISVAITGNPTKTYDGTTIATLMPSDYTLGGFVAGQGATITQTVGQYATAAAGQQPVFVTLSASDYQPNPGTDLSNYNLATFASGTGTILQRPLTASIIGNPTKVYDGTTPIHLAPANIALQGLVSGESINISAVLFGNFDIKNAGSRTASVTLLAPQFIPGSTTSLSNYILPTQATGPGTITLAPLQILGVSAQSKVYDQTTTATLAGTGTLYGVVAGDNVLLSAVGSAGQFAQANVGTAIPVTVTGFTVSGADATNYQLFQPAGLSADITARPLAIINLTVNNKLYDATNVATLGGAPTLGGVLGGDDVTLDSAGSAASFKQSSVGANLTVRISGYALAGAQAGNYALSQPSGLTASINPAPLTGQIIGDPTKTYDATTSVTLTSANYQLTGFVAGQGGAITQSASALYDSPDAGARTVTANLVASDFLASNGTQLSNYVLPTVITGPGTINPATVTASIIGNPTKVYDATTTATLTSANYQIFGFVGGQGATVTQTTGTYGQKDVGSRIVLAALVAGNFVANSGTNLANYNLTITASGSGTITPATIQVIGVTANNKVYDRTTAATLNNSAGGFSGVLGSDVVNLVSSGATGTFATRNVGVGIPVTAVGYTASGADAGNYTVLQPTGLSANITQAVLQLASVTKVYDASTFVPTADGAYTLSGVFAGDNVGVSAGGIAGNYAAKNVGGALTGGVVTNGISVTLSGVVLKGSDAGNYTIASGVTNALIGVITPATLTVSGARALDKTYDQTTIAQLDNTNTALSGVLTAPGGVTDVVNLTLATTGNFSNANAGVNKPVGVSAYAISGLDAGNYVLVQPNYLTATINPKPISLTSVVKTYNGTTALPSASGYGFTGVLSGDTVTANTSGVTGSYAQKDVGGSISGGVVSNGIAVTLTGLALSGASAGNYTIAPGVTNAAIGVINPAALTAAIVGTPTKVYDSTAAATLTNLNFKLTGFVSGEGATVTQTSGTYASANAGSRTVTASLTSGNFAPNAGTLLTDYVLPVSASGAGLINPRPLTISGIIAGNKIYDGTILASLDNSAAQLVNVVPGDTVSLNSSLASATFASPGVGTGIPVTAIGYTLGNNPFNNYTLSQPTGLAANITAALLTLIQVSKVYDGTTVLPGAATAYTLSGIVPGDQVQVNAAAASASGSYADKNVNTGILVTIGNLQLTGAKAADYTIASSVTNDPVGVIAVAALTAVIINNPTKFYDGNTVATLTSGNFALSGFVSGEGAAVTQTAGAYASKNAGGQLVSAVLGSANFTADVGTNLADYILPTSASGPGTIQPAPLTATIVGNPTKSYDGNASATLASANYQLAGFVSGEGATVTEPVGTYASAHAGLQNVSATLAGGNFAASSGTNLSNYVLPTIAVGLGTIAQAQLNAVIINDPTKAYDGNSGATLTSANYQLTGFVGSDGATVTQTAGVFDGPNVRAHVVGAMLASNDFVANSGTDLSNYILPVAALGPGTITPAILTAAIIGNPTKSYDSTTDATLVSANYQLTGFVSGEGATVDQAIGTYDSANAGARIVTANLASGNFTANSGTFLTNYILPTVATGPGTILAKPINGTLATAIVNNPTKVYDGTAIATLDPSDYLLTGFVGTDGAIVTQTIGQYASKNVGISQITALLSGDDFQANPGTNLANYLLPTQAVGPGTITPALLTAAIVGNPAKIFDGTTVAALTSQDYQLTGFVTGETATVSQAVGAYDIADAGQRTVTALLGSGNFVAGTGTLLSNYILPTSASGIGTIVPRPIHSDLDAVIVNNPTKIYDGTTVATLNPGNYQLFGFVGTDGATVTQTVGQYADKNAGIRQVTALLSSSDFVPNSGTNLANYTLPSEAAGPGTIAPGPLTLAIIGNPTKAYDGTRIASLTSGNYQLSGFISGESATVTQTVGSYSDRNAGARIVTASLAAGDFSAGSGTSLSNYILPTVALGAGTITQAQLTAAIVGNPAKTYNGNTDASLTSSDYQLTGFASGEGALVSQSAGTYLSPDAGVSPVIVALAPGDFRANLGTDLANYILPTGATGPGTIDPARLIASIIGIPAKIYDGSTGVALNSTNFLLSGFVGSEGATVTATAGTYDSPNVGLRTVTTALSSGEFVATGATNLANYILPATALGLATIERAQLAVAIVGNPTKTYDGTTNATLTSANYQLTGFIGGEGATVTQTSGTYGVPDVGINAVGAVLSGNDFAANPGTLLANYILPLAAAGLGTITPAQLVASIIGNPTKIYDGSAGVMLTGANYQLTGFVSGQGATIDQPYGTYDSTNAGARTVTAGLTGSDFTAAGGTSLSNYILPTSASGPGQIDRRDLTVAITGYPVKPYDGTNNAALTSGDYTLSGFIAGQGATITQVHGTYATSGVGVQTVTAQLGSGDYAANTGTLLSNYNLPTVATGPGEIVGPNPCLVDIYQCLPADIAYKQAVNSRMHFYIPYPTLFPIYEGVTGGLAALPSVITFPYVVETPDGRVLVAGSRVINSTEQVLSQQGGSKAIRIRYPDLPPVTLGGSHP
jgi:filamentous hemagglutinin family protein